MFDHMARLLASLCTHLGREQAKQEFKWMKQALDKGLIYAPTDLSTMVQRRLRGEPLQYILGTTPFGPLDLLTRPPILIPRPETEDWALRLANGFFPSPTRPLSVLDLCTGSGCIPLLLCHLWPPGTTRAIGVDISPSAIQLAIDNAVRCNIATYDEVPRTLPQTNTFTPLLGDIRDSAFLGSLKPPFDIVTANPPYIPKREYVELPTSVKDFEDPVALIGDPPEAAQQDGLSFYHCIAQLLSIKGMLKESAFVALEVGQGQAESVESILREVAAFREIDIWRDPWEKKRVVVARC
ncbi:hypothetical protein SERLA73DRAFT_179817 [Serpula lacrymans var. lacrymans S7.3]|uniref:Uncharacterized protein n=2 Tax=Serpula lacrymans var. lacrymans TaxID=341189 RepID=F8PUG1_SERL3|nr:uncharacterized protein SERLADRAFT_465105 [Serpula lacrymans var. lacrymans S7.9]EGN99681.1 hypothetical protein SERLA73DRAFT_179817 [Serpula lacrymans var. lacrymans S7.3]EGO25241.1 hypothetical protein SERLADRAFT_465105 [Serpula lacrymans var. lacrymans S7.9]